MWTPKAPPSATIMTGVEELTIVRASSKRPCAPMISATPRPVTNRFSTAAATEPSSSIEGSAPAHDQLDPVAGDEQVEDGVSHPAAQQHRGGRGHADRDRREPLDVGPARARGCNLVVRGPDEVCLAVPAVFGQRAQIVEGL